MTGELVPRTKHTNTLSLVYLQCQNSHKYFVTNCAFVILSGALENKYMWETKGNNGAELNWELSKVVWQHEAACGRE